MSVSFPYEPVPAAIINSQAAPSHPRNCTAFDRPLIEVRLHGPSGARRFPKVLVDGGAEDCVFPLDVVDDLGLTLLPDTGHFVKWRGKQYPLRFAEVELLIEDEHTRISWTAIVGFSNVPYPFQILGFFGGMEFFDVTYFGHHRMVQLSPNPSFSGSVDHLP